MNTKQKTTIYIMLILLLGIIFVFLFITTGTEPDNTPPAITGPTNTSTNIPETLTPTNTPTIISTPTPTFTLTLTPTSTSSPTVTTTPTLEPSAMISFDTRCYAGPGPAYILIGWLLTGTSVELVAIGQVGGWYIVNHPIISGVRCWVTINDLALVGINLDNYDLWADPPIPVTTPTPLCWTATPDFFPDIPELAATQFSDSWILHPNCL